jgi:hypothetical protein
MTSAAKIVLQLPPNSPVNSKENRPMISANGTHALSRHDILDGGATKILDANKLQKCLSFKKFTGDVNLCALK